MFWIRVSLFDEGTSLSLYSSSILSHEYHRKQSTLNLWWLTKLVVYPVLGWEREREREEGEKERFFGGCLKKFLLWSEGQIYGRWTAGIPLLTFSRQDLPISPRKLAGLSSYEIFNMAINRENNYCSYQFPSKNGQ